MNRQVEIGMWVCGGSLAHCGGERPWACVGRGALERQAALLFRRGRVPAGEVDGSAFSRQLVPAMTVFVFALAAGLAFGRLVGVGGHGDARHEGAGHRGPAHRGTRYSGAGHRRSERRPLAGGRAQARVEGVIAIGDRRRRQVGDVTYVRIRT